MQVTQTIEKWKQSILDLEVKSKIMFDPDVLRSKIDETTVDKLELIIETFCSQESTKEYLKSLTELKNPENNVNYNRMQYALFCSYISQNVTEEITDIINAELGLFEDDRLIIKPILNLSADFIDEHTLAANEAISLFDVSLVNPVYSAFSYMDLGFKLSGDQKESEKGKVRILKAIKNIKDSLKEAELMAIDNSSQLTIDI